MKVDTTNPLKNIFLMPCGASKTREHLHNTVLKPVEQSTILPTVLDETKQQLQTIFGDKDIAVWGSVYGRNNQVFFNKMRPGDQILFVVGKEVKVGAEIAYKTISPELSSKIWPEDNGRLYSLIYFLDNVKVVSTPLSEVFSPLGYSQNYILRGLSSVSEEKLTTFYEHQADIMALLQQEK